MIHSYDIEVYNMKANRWECFNTARTLDEAFDIAERAIGFDKDYDTVSILDMQGFVIWDSNGFRQGEGVKYVGPEETRFKNIGLEQQMEQTYVADDGSC
jgi:hypothetical protein